jgi:hypothetical protein
VPSKALASAMLRQTTAVLADLAKVRPDRYFGIMSIGKVYLAGGACRSLLTADSSVLWALPDCPKVSTRKQRGPGLRLGISSAKT